MAFLEHATDAIRSVLGDRTRILFIPFASGDPGAYAELVRRALAGLFRRDVPPANVPAGTDLSFLLGTTPRFDPGPRRPPG